MRYHYLSGGSLFSTNIDIGTYRWSRCGVTYSGAIHVVAYDASAGRLSYWNNVSGWTESVIRDYAFTYGNYLAKNWDIIRDGSGKIQTYNTHQADLWWHNNVEGPWRKWDIWSGTSDIQLGGMAKRQATDYFGILFIEGSRIYIVKGFNGNNVTIPEVTLHNADQVGGCAWNSSNKFMFVGSNGSKIFLYTEV